MPPSDIVLNARRRTYVRLIGDIRHALNQALAEEAEKRGLTRAEIARTLGKNKSIVTRKFSGTSNMTLETLADLAYALDRPIRIALPPRDATDAANAPPAGVDSDARLADAADLLE